ncbi:MAG: hypothetical protein JWP00_101 [Chloroflexi bacterium]|nr:hypothetical protein [Chloroflexota bacterium]
MSENFSPFKSEAQTTNAIIGNRYELLELIGQGAMSKVYRGRDSNLGRIVAIKFLREEYGDNPNFVARFYREARAVASLPTEHLVSIYDYGQHNTTYFIVMEYVEGKNLKEMLRQEGPYSPKEALKLATPVLLALKAAHAKGIIHRDIKPQNILVRQSDGVVKLTDFGVAYAHDNAQVTSTGMVIGTVDYMAPEQARGEPVGPPADLYAVGVVIFELLTGRLPYTGENTMQIIMGHISKPIPSLASQGVSAPPALERLVQRALAKDISTRFQSAQEMLNAFEMVLAEPEAPAFAAGSLDQLPAETARPQAGPAPVYQPTAVNPAMPRNTPQGTARFEPIRAEYQPEPANYNGYAPEQHQRPAQARPQERRPIAEPRRQSTRGWLIPVIIGLAVLGVIGWLLFNLVGNLPAQTQSNQVTGTTGTAQVTTTGNPAPAVTTAPAVGTNAAAPAPASTAAPVVPVSVRFAAGQLNGAYDRDDHTLFGRTEKALYGVGSGFGQGTINFRLDRAPTGKPVLRITGLDDELAAHCNFEVLVNGTPVFNGPNTFPNVPNNDNGVGGGDRYWGDMTIAIPASALKAGQNTLTLRNTTPWRGSLGVPYILINSVSLEG